MVERKEVYIEKIIQELIKEIKDKLHLNSIIQFGSSTYSKNAQDIDIMLISKQDIFSYEDILNLLKLIANFEKKYEDVSFDFSGTDRKRKREISITLLMIGKESLNVIHNPHDLIFFSDVKKDKNKKILYGENPFTNLKFHLTNQHIFEALSVNQKHALRGALDDEKYKLDHIYTLFKDTLRFMLINEEVSKKEELIDVFKNKYTTKIKPPKDFERILSHNLESKDFEDILKFSEDCLKYLLENK